MNLHAIRPRFHSKVPSLCESFCKTRTRIQTDPTPYARVDSIGSDNPLCLRDLFTKDSAFTGQTRDGRIPKQSNSALFRSLHHLLMEDGSTHSKTTCSRKVSFDRGRGVHEPDTAKHLAITWTNRDASLAQRPQGARHQPLSTRFVDRRLCTVRHGNVKTLHSRGDCCSQSRWPPTDDQHTSTFPHSFPFESLFFSRDLIHKQVRCLAVWEDARQFHHFTVRSFQSGKRVPTTKSVACISQFYLIQHNY